MAKTSRLLGVCIATALMLPVCATADQLPKQGTYTGVFGWSVLSGDSLQLDKDHTMWGGIATGAFRNDSGGGFLHAIAVKCTFSGEFMNGAVVHNNGDCVLTDKDGDKVSATWKCVTCPGTGEFEWTGGTGKYAGIKGRNIYLETSAGPPGSGVGFSVWKGEWHLP